MTDDVRARCVIGLDVGGTKTAGGIVTREGKVALERTIPTHAERGGEAVLRDVLELAERLRDNARQMSLAPAAIGISICELVDTDGRIVSDQTIQWQGLDVQRRFAQFAPTVIEADSRAAALCEARYGAGKEFPIFLYVTIGTGISSSLVIDGKPFVGARGITGTMATGPLTMICSSCGKMSTSVVERIASGPAIAMRYNEVVRGSVGGSESVLAAAESGDSCAREVVLTAAESVGSVVGLLVSVLDPHAVVIGGGLGSADGLYWETLQAATRRHIWSDQHRQLPIVQGQYGALAGLVGAAVAASERYA
jgi:glucokinase